MGLFSSLGSIAGSFFGPVGTAGGAALGGLADSAIGGLSSKRAADVAGRARLSSAKSIRNAVTGAQEALTPGREAYDQSVTSLSDILAGDMTGFYESPDYQFRLNEGLQTLENQSAAGRTLLSGKTLTDVTDYAQQAASQEFGNYLSRRAGLAELTQPDATTSALLPYQAESGRIADLLTERGDVRAGGISGVGAATQGAVRSLADYFSSASMPTEMRQVSGTPWRTY